MPLAVAALTSSSWWPSSRASPGPSKASGGVRQRLAAGQSAGLGVEADLLRAEAGSVGAAECRAEAAIYDRLARLAEQAGYPGRANDFSSMSAAVPSSASCSDGCGPASSSGGSVRPPPWAPLPLLFLAWKRQQRMQQFEAQFPDGLDAMARAIRAGNALEHRRPARRPRRCRIPSAASSAGYSRKSQLGMDPGDALSRLAERTADGRRPVLLHRRRHPARLGREPRRDPGPAERSDPRAVQAPEPCSRPLGPASLVRHLRGAQPAGLRRHPRAADPGYFAPLMESPLAPLLLGAGSSWRPSASLMVWRIAQIKV